MVSVIIRVIIRVTINRVILGVIITGPANDLESLHIILRVIHRLKSSVS